MGISPNALTINFGTPAFVPGFLQSPAPDPNLAPPWNPVNPCGQIAGPGEIYADDPEQWTYTVHGSNPPTWVNPANGQQYTSMLLEKGSFTPSSPGLIFFYFQNLLGQTARLWIGGVASSGSATLNYQAAESAHAGSKFTTIGALETTQFLTEFETATGVQSASVSAGATPTPILNYTVKTGELVTGEWFVSNLSEPVTFYVYADDCTGTPCPAQTNTADDGHHRRGYFGAANFLAHHDFTASIETTAGGFSWADVVGNGTCAPPLSGIDPIDGMRAVKNKGDYGATIEITGTPNGQGGGQEFSQYWFAGPSAVGFGAGKGSEVYAMWLKGFTDPNTGVDILPSAWALPMPTPFASPTPTPSPQPSPTPMACCRTAAALGLDKLASTRDIIFIPSGGDAFPARFWYLIPVTAAKGR